MGDLLQFPARPTVIWLGSAEEIELAKHRQRILGRYCKVRDSARSGFVDALEWRGGELRAQMSRTDGGAEWLVAESVEPASKGRVL